MLIMNIAEAIGVASVTFILEILIEPIVIHFAT